MISRCLLSLLLLVPLTLVLLLPLVLRCYHRAALERYKAALRATVAQGIWLVPLREAKTNVTRPTGPITRVPDFINSGSGLSYTNVAATYAGVEAQRSLVLAAIALEGYQLKHGLYSESLKTLVPEFLAALPRDPMDDQPLRYRRRDPHFLHKHYNAAYPVLSMIENALSSRSKP